MTISQRTLDAIKDGTAQKIDEMGAFIESETWSMRNKRPSEITDDKDIKALSEALKKTPNNALKELTISPYFGIGEEAFDALSAALTNNPTLSELHIDRYRKGLGSTNYRGDSAAIRIATAAESCPSLHSISMPLNCIHDAGITAFAQAAARNPSIMSLNLHGNFISSNAASQIAKIMASRSHFEVLFLDGSENSISKDATIEVIQALEGKNIVAFNINHLTDPSVADALIKRGGKNLVRVPMEGLPDSLKNYLSDNLQAAEACRERLEADIDYLSAEELEEIIDRLPAIIHGAETGWGGKKITSQEIASLLLKLQNAAIASSINMEIPARYIDLVDSAAVNQPLLGMSISFPNKAELNASLESIAKNHFITPEELLGRDLNTTLHLTEIEQLLSEGSVAEKSTPIQQARSELANHVITPHIDYFIISALRVAENPQEVDFSDYPNIQRAAGTQYDLAKFKQQARQRVNDDSTLHFDYLLDPTRGDHMARLRRALGEVNGTIGQYEGLFAAIDKQIAEIGLKIDQQRGLADERGHYLAGVRKENAFRTDRMFEYTTRRAAALSAADAKSVSQGSRTAGQTIAYAAAKLFKGVPFLEGLTEVVSEQMGVPTVGGMAKSAHEIATTQAAARIEAKASSDIVAYYSAKQIDEGAIENEIATIKTGMAQLHSNADFKRLEQDKTKQQAIAKAFVNKLMLGFGLHMSEGLQAACEEHGLEKIDDVFAAFESNPRYKEALTNLCFGIADSNDLSVIFAETAALQGESPAEQVAKAFVEDTLKPNVDDLYMHASKVDLIYQANMTGLGTPFHNARHMIRGEHDLRVRALFGDSFGVDSQMGALTVRGALDVKNMFDFYLHRHGKNTLTDTKIHDGLVTGKKAPKRVSVLDDDAIAEHVELAKSSRGYRQDGPDISDMFLRICGYEYFYPQAPNDAMRTNIMANNPEAPAAYVMANKVIKSFIEKMSMNGLEDYRAKVGTKGDGASKLDNLIAQTFMDYFSELGSLHAADPKLGAKRADLKMAAKETGTFSFAFDAYERLVSKDALSRFDLFLEIYARNLEKQLEIAPEHEAKALKAQIEAVAEVSEHLNPKVIAIGSEESRHRARLANHSYENTHWRGAM